MSKVFKHPWGLELTTIKVPPDAGFCKPVLEALLKNGPPISFRGHILSNEEFQDMMKKRFGEVLN